MISDTPGREGEGGQKRANFCGRPLWMAPYVLKGSELRKTDQEKDLGVLTSGNLLWNDQIKSCISKANQMLCGIARNLISREKTLMLRIYKT